MRFDVRMFLARFGLATTVLVATAAVAPSVSAQCAFDQPNGSSSYVGLVSASLVRAFVSCNNPGGNTPNVAMLGGTVPGCAPVENYHQQAGSPPAGGHSLPGTSYGRVQIKRTSGGPNVGGYPTTARDAAVILKMYHIDRADGGPGFASGNGVVQIIFRATLQRLRLRRCDQHRLPVRSRFHPARVARSPSPRRSATCWCRGWASRGFPTARPWKSSRSP